jgi:hypothetical protein
VEVIVIPGQSVGLQLLGIDLLFCVTVFFFSVTSVRLVVLVLQV